MTQQDQAAARPQFPAIRDIPLRAPLDWLARGWADLRGCPGPSLFYGLCFAAIVFALSAISIPLMLDRNQDTVTAMIASVLALGRNLPAMAAWAALIVLLTALGLATLFIGLIVAMPLIGHATWHAYRDLVT